MKPEEYQKAVQHTSAEQEREGMLFLSFVGFLGEMGEVAELIKKHLWNGKPLREDHLTEELGDVLWYYTLICNAYHISLERIFEVNLVKMKQRFPDGWDYERARSRIWERDRTDDTYPVGEQSND